MSKREIEKRLDDLEELREKIGPEYLAKLDLGLDALMELERETRERRDEALESGEGVAEAEKRLDKIRAEALELSMFRRILTGDAPQRLTKFALKNKAPGRWSDRIERTVELLKPGDERKEMVDEFPETFGPEEEDGKDSADG